MMFLCLTTIMLFGCTATKNPDADKVKATVMRYNQLVADGYRNMNMTTVQEVATEEQATRLYYHMAAISEGKLKMDSTLKNIAFVKFDFSKPDVATVETRESWDFTHIEILTGKKFAEEKDFIYEMGYILNKRNGRWIVTNVNTISGTSTNSVIPWPQIDRKGGRTYPAGKSPDDARPAGHP